MKSYKSDKEVYLKDIDRNTGSKNVHLEVRETTTTGTVTIGAAKVAIYVSGAAEGSITVSGTTITAYPNVSYIFGGDKNDRLVDVITYDATGTEFQLIIERIVSS